MPKVRWTLQRCGHCMEAFRGGFKLCAYFNGVWYVYADGRKPAVLRGDTGQYISAAQKAAESALQDVLEQASPPVSSEPGASLAKTQTGGEPK